MKTLLMFACLFALHASAQAADWTRFRGPNGSGKVTESGIPLEWSSNKHLKWRAEVPGKGTSSPVVAGNQIYVTAYTGYGLSLENPGDSSDLVRHVLAYDRATGKELWRFSVKSTAKEDPYRGFIVQHGYASSSVATDGQQVYAVLGKSGLFALDRQGNQLWQYDLGQKSDPAKWGDGSSPILWGDLVIVDAGILGNQLVAVNKNTGEKAWAIEDSSFTNSWSTPIVMSIDGRDQVLFNMPGKVLAVDPATGDKLWSARSPLNDAACGGIIASEDKVFLMGSRAGRAIGIRCGGSGDISDSNTLWQTNLRSGIVTPVVIGERMYWTSGGLFYAASLQDGEYVYKKRLPRLGGPTGSFPNADYSSPVAVGNNIILFTRNGESYVIAAGDQWQLLSHNPPFEDDDTAFSSSPAIADDELFIRSEKYLYSIAP